MKKLLLTFFALVLCLSALCLCIAATEGEATEPVLLSSGQQPATGTASYKWELYDDGTLKMIAGSGTQFGSNGTYTEFSTWRQNTKIVVDGVEKTVDDIVKYMVFDKAFKNIMVQNGAKYVVTANWENLESIDLGSIYRIQNYNTGSTGVFENNPKLKKITNSSTSVDNADYVANLSKLTRYDNANDMNYMFENTPLIQKVVLATSKNSNNKLTALGTGMFLGATGLKEITIPSWITSIKGNAFKDCTSLESIVIPSGITSITSTAFTGCTALKEITLESTLSVSALVLPDNEGLKVNCATKAQFDEIKASGYTNVIPVFGVAPGNLMSDGSGYQYAIEDGVLTIEKAETTSGTVLKTDLTLDFIADVTTVIIPEETGITEIGANMFDGWAATTVVVPSTLKTVSSMAFANMPNLTTVVDYTAYTADSTAGSGVINIMSATLVAMDAFSGSSSALSPVVYFGSNVSFTGENFAFFAADATRTLLVYPSTKVTTYFRENDIAFDYLTEEQTGDKWLAREMTINSFKWSFDTETGTLNIIKNTTSGSNNVDVGKNQETWPAWKAVWADAIEYFFVDNSITGYVYYQHNNSPFSNLPNLKHIHMGGIKNIRRSSYSTNGLYQNCPSLTTVSYGTDNTYDEVIDLSWWRKNDYMMKSMLYNCSSVKEVILPENLGKYDEDSSSVIGVFDYFFYGCSSLEEVTIPECFSTLGIKAFVGCTNLKTINLVGEPTYFAPDTFPDQDGLTIKVANYGIANLFEYYNFTLTQVTYPEGTYSSSFVAPSQPVTNVIGDFSAVRPLNSAEELNAIMASSTPPAVVLVDIDSALNVEGLDMTASELLAALEYRVFAAFRVSDSATVTALADYLISIDFTDTYVVGAPELIAQSYARMPRVHHVADFSDTYSSEITIAQCNTVRLNAYSNGAKMAILPLSACTKENIKYLYSRSVTLWVELPENPTATDKCAAVLSGAIGAITEDTDDILNIACNEIPADSLTRTPMTSGHRGNETVCPENTLEGCLYAAQHGAESLEFDVYLTTDGHVVLMHDGDTERTCNANLTVEKSTLAQLKELYVNKGFENHELYSQCRIPTLNEIFEGLKDYDVLFNIEIKSSKDEIVDAIVALIKEYDVYGKCCFSTFKASQFARMHELYPELSGILLFRDANMQDYSADLNAVHVLKSTGRYNANVSLYNTESGAGKASVAALLRRGVPVQNWKSASFANSYLSGMHMISDANYVLPKAFEISGLDEETVITGETVKLGASYTNYRDEVTTVTDVTYKIVDGADLATINNETGTITFGDEEGSVTVIATYNYVYNNSSGTYICELSAVSDVYTVEIVEGEQTVLTGAQYKSDGVTARFTWAFDTETGVMTFTNGSDVTLNSSNNYTAFNTWRSQYETLLDEKLTKIVLVGIETIQYQHKQSPLAGYASLKTIDFGRNGTMTLQNGYASTYGAFSANPSLTTIYVNGGLAEGDAEGVINLSKLRVNTEYTSSSPANAYMFSGDKAITKVIMPNSAYKCAYICPGMFRNCESLTEITIPSYVTKIYKDAFSGCTSLTYVNVLGTLADGVAETAFPDSDMLRIEVPDYNTAAKFDTCGFTKTQVVYPFDGIVTMDGFSVRLTKYNGLRGLFSADFTNLEKPEYTGYELLEFGTLVSAAVNRENCVLSGDVGSFTVGKGIIKATVWDKDNGVVGKYLSSTDEKLEYAVTVVNFAEANYMSDVYFCSYEVWKNANGETEIIYRDCDGTDYDEISLARMCNIMYENGVITAENDTEGMVKALADHYEENRTKNILFIGNSFTYYNDMPTAIFPVAAKAAGKDVAVTAITNGGHTLAEFADSSDTYGKKVADAFANNKYDIVIIQEQSHRPVSNPESFYSAVRDLKEMARVNGAETYLYATWGYDADHSSLSNYGKDTAEMEIKLRAAYEYIGSELNIPVCHVGAAMTYAFTNSNVSLYNSDNYHPLKTASTLAAMTIASEIYGVDPADFDLTIDGINADDMSALKTAASYVHNNDMSVPEEYKTSSENPLEGKRIIFIGNSHIYYGCTVMYKNPGTTLTQAARDFDEGYFYQLCKANGMEVNVTNWTFSNHVFGNLFGGVCSGTSNNYECAGVDHSSYLVDPYFDYVVACYGTTGNTAYAAVYDKMIDFFTDANPNVKMYLMAQASAHGVHVKNDVPDFDFLASLKTWEDKGVTVIDWGKLIADLVSGEAKVPGATLDYNMNTFVVSQSSSDGFHPNQLTGYITTLMTYCVLTGESAVGQPYYFVGDDSYSTASYYRTFEEYITAYYKNGATTNYDQVFASEADMLGIQKLVDEYIAAEHYKNYNPERAIFIGDSFVYYGNAVVNEPSSMTQASRSKDEGYFYQLCKANGRDVNVTNWTFGSHGIGNIRSESCTISGCDGKGTNHMANITNPYYDYVIISGGRNSASVFETVKENLEWYVDFFRSANPNVKFYYLVSSGAHNVSVAESFPIDVLNNLDEFEKLGFTIIDWGKLVADIINGDVTVPGATLEYNKDSFVVNQSSSDGYHPNQLAGYITSLMTYHAIYGDSAVGQPYDFCGNKSFVGSATTNYMTFDKYISTYYKNGATTNYPEIFASESDMTGLQTLIDQYFAEKAFRDYNFQ